MLTTLLVRIPSELKFPFDSVDAEEKGGRTRERSTTGVSEDLQRCLILCGDDDEREGERDAAEIVDEGQRFGGLRFRLPFSFSYDIAHRTEESLQLEQTNTDPVLGLRESDGGVDRGGLQSGSFEDASEVEG